MINRILRGDHEKRRLQAMSCSIDRDARFSHCFQKSRLSPGRRSINFIGQENIGKNRTASEFKILCSLIKNRRPVMSDGSKSGVH